MTTIQKKITVIIKLVCDENKKEATLINNFDQSISLRDDLQLDSLEMAELMIRIEDEFGVDIFEDGPVTTIGEIFEKIEVTV